MEEARTPQFFKVLVGDFARRIEIPQAFLCHIPEGSRRTPENSGASSAKFILSNAEGKTWPVELYEADGRVFVTTGWPTFVEDNCLGEGEFLIFKSDGGMHFKVLVFGVNAVEKSVWSSESGARATGNLEEKPTFPSSNKGHSGDKLMDMDTSLTHSHSQTVTLQSTERDEHISSQNVLGTCLSWMWPMEDGKAQAIAKVMRTLDVDRLTVDLFCAMLSLYKWNAEAAAEEFDICRGKQQIPREQSLKRKLVSQFNFVKEQMHQFFPPDDSSCAPMHEETKNNLGMPNLANQSLHCDLIPVKRKLPDKYESCDLPHHQKRKVCKLQRGSHTQTPRRSQRLAHLKDTSDGTNNILKERSEVREPSPAPENQVKDRLDKTCLLQEKKDSVSKGIHEEALGFLSQDFRSKNGKERTEKNVLMTSETFTSTGCIGTESLPINSELTSDSRITEVYFTWKPSQQGNRVESILLDIERENFMNTIAHVQKIIRDEGPDLQTANIIEDIVRKGILKWGLCLQDSNAQKVVNALLEHAKIVKEQQNFNIEVRKEEFSAKLQDRSKWQLKELETGYTSLELHYKKATADANICFLTLEKHKKKLHAFEDDIREFQQATMMKEDELQKLRHLVSEHQIMYQKSIMEKVRAKMALKSYQQTLDEVKRRLASTEPGSVDVEALVKEEMDTIRKEIELLERSILSIRFMKSKEEGDVLLVMS